MADIEVGIRLTADGKGLSGTVRVAEKDVERLGKAAGRGARGIERTGRAAEKAERGLRGWIKRLRHAHGATLKYLGVGGAVATAGTALVAFARHTVGAGVAMERWQSRLRAATGSTDAAAREIGFLRRESERLGIDFAAAADGFSGFAAAARGTALAGEETRRIFTGVAEAAAVMRLSAADVQGVFTALEQIMSKGTVSAEELRGQLGERLAGAFQIAARSMGRSTEELDKLLRLGQLSAQDFLPKFAVALRAEFGRELDAATDSATAAFARFGNAWRDLGVAIAESGVLEALGDFAGAAAAALRTLSGTDIAAPVEDRLAARERDLAELPAYRGHGRGRQSTAGERQRLLLEIERLRE